MPQDKKKAKTRKAIESSRRGAKMRGLKKKTKALRKSAHKSRSRETDNRIASKYGRTTASEISEAGEKALNSVVGMRKPRPKPPISRTSGGRVVGKPPKHK